MRSIKILDMTRENNLFKSLISTQKIAAQPSIFSPDAALGIKTMAEKGISDNKNALYAKFSMYRNIKNLECFLKS